MTVDTDWIVDFFRRQARLGFEEGDYTRTRNSCREVLQYVPDDVEIWSLLGEAALASHDSVTALRAFDQLVDIEPDNAEHAMKLGKASLQAQDWPAAVAAFQQVLVLQPEHQGAAEALVLIKQLQDRLNILGQLPTGQPGRNDPCPCGSGLKYKKCCLAKSSQVLIQQRFDQAFAAEDWQQALSIADELQARTASIRRAIALARYQLSQREPAYPLIKAAYAELPDDRELQAALADLELDHDIYKAQALAESVLSCEPGQWRASLVLAAVYARLDQPDMSEAALRELLKYNPNCNLAWQRLSYFLRKSQRLEDDLSAMREWTERCPDKPDAWCHRGMSTVMTQRPQEAREYLQKALELDPDHYEALCWMGQSYQEEKEPHRALEFLMRGLQRKPDYQPGWNMLGELYRSVGRQHESEGCFMRALAISPQQVLAWNNLANTYQDGRLGAEAEKVMQVALQLNSTEPSLWNNFGNILAAGRRLEEARSAYQKALEIQPDYKPVLISLAAIESHFGNLDKAIELLQQVGFHPGARTNMLFFANYHPDWSGERIFDLYKDVVRFFPERQYFDYANSRQPTRRLRVGYVSPDFYQHVCAIFVEPLLKNHDHDQFEIYAYSLARREDQVTERFMGYADHWRHCVGLSDKAVAELIRADGIDILVDLAGHTSGNRLQVFAMKPAPIQMTWLGFGYTTGLKAMDYYLVDAELVPVGSEHLFSEKPWRLPCPPFTYNASPSIPPVTSLPALRNEYITFGTLTRPIRLNYKVVRAWAEILKRVPRSRLIINSSAFDDAVLVEHYVKKFVEHGVARDRLEIGFESPPWPVLGNIDIALDCFPHNSGTTLFESLWCGLPYITLRDRPSMGRLGASILSGLNRHEWIANSEEDYVEKAVALASDIDGLVEIRGSLRTAMQGSSLCDGASFAKYVEQAYRGMWLHYCEEGEQA